MKIDEKATAAARARHETGVKRLCELFNIDLKTLVAQSPRGGHAVGSSKIERVRWRQWNDK